MRYKQWPIAHCIVLAEGLIADGLQVVLSGGPSAADRARTAEEAHGVGTAGADDRLLDLGGALYLNQVVTLLRCAALYIGPDTSITHLAAACVTPLLALYGPIDPRLFGPWPQGHGPLQPYVEHARRQQPRAGGAAPVPAAITLLQGDPSCVPCNGMGCEGHVASRSDCLETMSPQRVLAEARELLGGPPADTRPASMPVRAVPVGAMPVGAAPVGAAPGRRRMAGA